MYTDTTAQVEISDDASATVAPVAPTSYTLNVHANALRGLLLAAAKEDVRYYLNGIFCEPSTGILVATNGHYLMMHTVEGAESIDGIEPFIIPRELAERAVKLVAKSTQPVLSIHVEGATGTARSIMVQSHARGQTVTEIMREIDGRFPEWRKAVPKSCSGVLGEFNPALMARVQKALGTAYGVRDPENTFIRVEHNGTNALRVSCGCDRTLAFLMPWRSGDWQGDPPALAKLGLAPEQLLEQPEQPQPQQEPQQEQPQQEEEQKQAA